jgi:hypothetical protein
VQRLLEPLASRMFRVHLLREPLDYLGLLRFKIELNERSKAGVVEEIVARKEG